MDLWNVLLLAVTVFASVAINTIFNYAGKHLLHTTTDRNYFFTLWMTGCAALSVAVAVGQKVSLFTFLFALLYGLFTNLCTLYKVRALHHGPVHLTTILITGALIFPTLIDFFLPGVPNPTALSLLGTALLLSALVVSNLGTDQSGGKITKKWAFRCAVSALANGAIGISQKLHQISDYRDEIGPFLAISFLLSGFLAALSTLLSSRKEKSTPNLPEKPTHLLKGERYLQMYFLIAALAALSAFLMNYLQVLLSGRFPSGFFFPMVNAIPIAANTLVALLLFKEKLNKYQWIGFALTLLSLVLIGLG